MTTQERKDLKKIKSNFKKSIIDGTYPGHSDLIQQIATFPVKHLRANWVFKQLKFN